MQHPDTTKLNSFLESARHIAVLLPKNPTYDMVAAALSLKLGLEAAGRTVTVACSEPMTVEFHRLVGVDKVSSTFGSRNMVITFPGQTENVDKVSYNIENGVLQLVITPKPETPGLDHHKLHFVSGGATADAVFFIGVKDLSDLGQMYVDAKDFLSQASAYYIDGPLFSQEVTQIVNSLNLPLSSDMASNLLSGIETATNNFQLPNVGPETFEAAAVLMRKGARRQSNLAQATEYPAGSIPTANQPQPADDWYEPKVYSDGARLT
jgi:hypothetical protein